jgi:hypothetical protein
MGEQLYLELGYEKIDEIYVENEDDLQKSVRLGLLQLVPKK